MAEPGALENDHLGWLRLQNAPEQVLIGVGLGF